MDNSSRGGQRIADHLCRLAYYPPPTDSLDSRLDSIAQRAPHCWDETVNKPKLGSRSTTFFALGILALGYFLGGPIGSILSLMGAILALISSYIRLKNLAQENPSDNSENRKNKN
jgi:hypothetical protein